MEVDEENEPSTSGGDPETTTSLGSDFVMVTFSDSKLMLH
jgi:hypothetical protein